MWHAEFSPPPWDLLQGLPLPIGGAMLDLSSLVPESLQPGLALAPGQRPAHLRLSHPHLRSLSNVLFEVLYHASFLPHETHVGWDKVTQSLYFRWAKPSLP